MYLNAWRYVASLSTDPTAEGTIVPAVAALVLNWTNPEFVHFVDDLADIVNR